ncbi:MAG: hypothetical protein KF819_10060 [Labilithrix sp.]|nr:hypothetical protein [Labilithrix sp.]
MTSRSEPCPSDGTCSSACPCGERRDCKDGRCASAAGWRIEELALGGAVTACARYANGKVLCAGTEPNYLGRGEKPAKSSLVPDEVVALDDARRLVAGTLHTCALSGKSTVSCWGLGGSGETGTGAFGVEPVPAVLASLVDVTAIASRSSHTCAVRKSGAVACWGWNLGGQLGDGTRTNRATPLPVKGVTDAKDVAVGLFHSCAIRRGGGVTCWGRAGGANGVAAPVAGVGAVDELVATDHDTCVRTGGTVTCWGAKRGKPAPLPDVMDATRLAAGNSEVCVLRQAGTVTCFDLVDDKRRELTLAGRPVDARLVTMGSDWACFVGKDERVHCPGHPLQSAFEQL